MCSILAPGASQIWKVPWCMNSSVHSWSAHSAKMSSGSDRIRNLSRVHSTASYITPVAMDHLCQLIDKCSDHFIWLLSPIVDPLVHLVWTVLRSTAKNCLHLMSNKLVIRTYHATNEYQNLWFMHHTDLGNHGFAHHIHIPTPLDTSPTICISKFLRTGGRVEPLLTTIMSTSTNKPLLSPLLYLYEKTSKP